MNETARARVAAFHRRHGGVCYADESKWYYPDGAYRDVNPLGVLAEPLDSGTREGEHRNAESVVMFYKLKLRDAAAKFDNLNFRLSSTLPADPKQALRELGRLRDAVEEAKKELADAEAKLDATEIGRYRRSVKEAREEQRRQWEEFHKKRRALRV